MYNIYIKEKKEEEEKIRKKQQNLYIDSPKYKRERDIMVNSYNKRINDYIIENAKNNNNNIKIHEYKSPIYHPRNDFIKVNEKKIVGKKLCYQNKNNIQKISKSLELNKQFNVSKISFMNKIKNDISIKPYSNVNKSNIINSEINFNKILSSIMNREYVGSENNNIQFDKDINSLKKNFCEKFLRNKSDSNLFDDFLNNKSENKRFNLNKKYQKISKNSIKNNSLLSPQHKINNNPFLNRISKIKIKIKKNVDNHHSKFKSVMRIANNLKDLSLNNYNSTSERKIKSQNKEIKIPTNHYINFLNPNKIKKIKKDELGNIDILKKFAFDKDYFDSQKEESDEIMSDLEIFNMNKDQIDFGIPQEDKIIIENKQYNIKKDINLLAKKVLGKYNVIKKTNSKIIKIREGKLMNTKGLSIKEFLSKFKLEGY